MDHNVGGIEAMYVFGMKSCIILSITVVSCVVEIYVNILSQRNMYVLYFLIYVKKYIYILAASSYFCELKFG